MPGVLETIGAVVTALGGASTIATVVGIGATLASASEQRKAAGLQRRQQRLQTQRSRRSAIRKTVLARAQAASRAQSAGSSGGSGFFGGRGAQASNLGSAIGYQGQQNALSEQVGSAQSNANTYSGISSLAFSFMGGSRQGSAEIPDLTTPVT